jgi:hypothetical protein
MCETAPVGVSAPVSGETVKAVTLSEFWFATSISVGLRATYNIDHRWQWATIRHVAYNLQHQLSAYPRLCAAALHDPTTAKRARSPTHTHTPGGHFTIEHRGAAAALLESDRPMARAKSQDGFTDAAPRALATITTPTS